MRHVLERYVHLLRMLELTGDTSFGFDACLHLGHHLRVVRGLIYTFVVITHSAHTEDTRKRHKLAVALDIEVFDTVKGFIYQALF